MVPALFSFGDLSVGVSVPKYLLLPHPGVLGSEARGGKSSEVSQTRNPGKEVEPGKPVGGKQTRRGHCSLGGQAAVLQLDYAGGHSPREEFSFA